jgi:predicted dehydrogenase
VNLAVGVIGMGLLGRRHAAIFGQLPEVSLTGVVDVNPSARAYAESRFGVRAYSSWPEMLNSEELDAATICLPDNLHFETTLGVVEAGLHVLVEKPLTMNVAEGERLVEVAASTEGVFMVGHMLRFDPRYDLARRCVRSGQIGQVNHLYTRRNSAVNAVQRYGDSVRLMWHVSIHDIDLIRYVTGQEVACVTAHANDRRLGEIGQLDSLLALLQLDDGTPCAIESCWVLPAYFKDGLDAQLEVVGTEGVIEVTGLEQGLRLADGDGLRYPDTTRFFEFESGSVGGVLKNELEHFVYCIRTGRDTIATAEDGLAAMRVAAAIEQSLATNQTVTLLT